MARQKENNGVQELSVFSSADYEKLENAKSVIADAQNRAEGLAERIAGQLYVVNLNKLYELDDCKNTAEWADKEFGISKGTVSDAINTFTRFGDMDNKDRIAEKYSQYMFSSLIRMKGLSDEQIEQAGITPTMSRKQITDAIAALKVLEDKQAELPKLVKRWEDCWNKLTKIMEDDKQGVRFIERYCPEYFTEDKTTTDMYETLITKADEYLDLYNEWSEIIASMTDAGIAFDEVMKDAVGLNWTDCTYYNEGLQILIDACKSALDKVADNPFNEEKEENEEHVQQEDTAGSEDDSPHTMPTITINVADYINDGKTNTKELLARVKEELAKVVAHEADIVITNIG